MRFTIKQGHHQDTRPFSSWPHFGRMSMSRYVTFHESCAYELPSYNALDVNKLFGLSFGFFALHEDSARFGWRWNAQEQVIELLAYCYIKGRRNWDAQMNFPVVAQVKLGHRVHCGITRIGYHYWFWVVDSLGTILGEQYVYHNNREMPAYGLTHGLYFGGSKPAPHDMHVTMTKG